MLSKNIFDIRGDVIDISWSNSEGELLTASTTVRNDYLEEIKSVTWGVNGKYFHNSNFGYLHRYIMSKWYGQDILDKMSKEKFIVDHMDNNSFNCRIENLSFLSADENKAKGFTVDKQAKVQSWNMALNMFNDFTTGCYQITIFFNVSRLYKDANTNETYEVSTLKLLYESNYEIVINDARYILLSNKDHIPIDLDKLNFSEYKFVKSTKVILADGDERNYVYIDGALHILIKDNCRVFKVNYDKGWEPTKEGEINGRI